SGGSEQSERGGSSTFPHGRPKEAEAPPGGSEHSERGGSFMLSLGHGRTTRLERRRRLDVAGKQRVPVARGGGELGVELYAHEPGMGGKLHDLGQAFGGRTRTDDQTALFQLGNVEVVD